MVSVLAGGLSSITIASSASSLLLLRLLQPSVEDIDSFPSSLFSNLVGLLLGLFEFSKLLCVSMSFLPSSLDIFLNGDLSFSRFVFLGEGTLDSSSLDLSFVGEEKDEDFSDLSFLGEGSSEEGL